MGLKEFFKRKFKRTESSKSKQSREKNHRILKNSPHYIKALPLMGLADIPSIETELKVGNVIILNISHFLNKSETKLRELKRAVEQLTYVTKIQEGEIAQLGDKHLLITPSPSLKIWKEKFQIEY